MCRRTTSRKLNVQLHSYSFILVRQTDQVGYLNIFLLQFLRKSSRVRSRGVPKIFRAPMYEAHCAVIFAIAQLSCLSQDCTHRVRVGLKPVRTRYFISVYCTRSLFRCRLISVDAGWLSSRWWLRFACFSCYFASLPVAHCAVPVARRCAYARPTYHYGAMSGVRTPR